VSIETLRGTVYLSGFVESIEVRQHAAELAWQVNGVREVVNSLEIRGRR
jgi:osmotically-inducible protein OsmY